MNLFPFLKNLIFEITQNNFKFCKKVLNFPFKIPKTNLFIVNLKDTNLKYEDSQNSVFM